MNDRARYGRVRHVYVVLVVMTDRARYRRVRHVVLVVVIISLVVICRPVPINFRLRNSSIVRLIGAMIKPLCSCKAMESWNQKSSSSGFIWWSPVGVAFWRMLQEEHHLQHWTQPFWYRAWADLNICTFLGNLSLALTCDLAQVEGAPVEYVRKLFTHLYTCSDRLIRADPEVNKILWRKTFPPPPTESISHAEIPPSGLQWEHHHDLT